MQKIIEAVFRTLGGCILVFFAYIPGSVIFHIIAGWVTEPHEFEWATLVGLAFSSLLLYFFILLAYRAFTGHGRKKDDRLLPPWALKLFIGAFGVIAILIMVFGLHEGKWHPVIGGLLYLAISLKAYAITQPRQKRHQTKA